MHESAKTLFRVLVLPAPTNNKQQPNNNNSSSCPIEEAADAEDATIIAEEEAVEEDATIIAEAADKDHVQAVEEEEAKAAEEAEVPMPPLDFAAIGPCRDNVSTEIIAIMRIRCVVTRCFPLRVPCQITTTTIAATTTTTITTIKTTTAHPSRPLPSGIADRKELNYFPVAMTDFGVYGIREMDSPRMPNKT